MRDLEKTIMVRSLALVALFLCQGAAWAEQDQTDPTENFLFGLGLGYGLVRFDTNFKFTDKDTGDSVYVDAEGNLDLPETGGVPIVYGYWRIARKHGLGFSYFRIKRESTFFDEQINLGDITVSGSATLTDKSSFMFLGYNYTVFEDDRSFVFASFGLYALDLKYVFGAEGEISVDGVLQASNSYSAQASIFAPLPLFGIDAKFNFTPRWSLGSKVALVGGSFNDVSALVLDTTVRARYQFNRRIGALFGITYFSADVDNDKEDTLTEVSYGFNGVFLGVDLSFY
jgi:hypothetical protein